MNDSPLNEDDNHMNVATEHDVNPNKNNLVSFSDEFFWRIIAKFILHTHMYFDKVHEVPKNLAMLSKYLPISQNAREFVPQCCKSTIIFFIIFLQLYFDVVDFASNIFIFMQVQTINITDMAQFLSTQMF